VAAALLGALLEPTLLRPLYRRAEEYQLLITFGLLLILNSSLISSAAMKSRSRKLRPARSGSRNNRSSCPILTESSDGRR